MSKRADSEKLAHSIPIVTEQLPRSQSRSRMVVERTEVRQGHGNCIGPGDSSRGGYMQVEISMALETMHDESTASHYIEQINRKPERIGEKRYRKELHECYRENRRADQREEYTSGRERSFDEWISSVSTDHPEYRINEACGNIIDDAGRMEQSDKKSKPGSLREFLSDYESIVNNTSQLEQTEERIGGESDYRSESTTYEETVSTTRYSDSATPEYSIPIRNTLYNSNPIRLTGDATITTETTVTTATALKKVASGSRFPDDSTIAVS